MGTLGKRLALRQLTDDIVDEIEERCGARAGGFGSVRVEVTVGSTTWSTSVFRTQALDLHPAGSRPPSGRPRVYTTGADRPLRAEDPAWWKSAPILWRSERSTPSAAARYCPPN
ncbi:MAG: DUF1905 domain-containing protein [Ilumatobacteraceae bacterium]